MLKTLTCVLLLAPSLALADQCRFEAPRNAALDMTGIHTVVIDIGHHTLHLNGTTSGVSKIHGRACASSTDRLAELQITQHRDGDRLIVSPAESHGMNFFSFFGSSYAYLDLQMDIPDTVAVELDVGSGDAFVSNVAQLNAGVGSGDLDVNSVRGRFGAHVGSGDIKAHDVGETHVTSIGSGDFTANLVRGNLSIGRIGSGDADLRAVGGNVDVQSIGSGDLRVNGVARDLHVAHVGSGEVDHLAVAGKVDVPRND
ncbi:MAG: hypothetical protein ABI365_00515 [Lysobacteraceae bacterium]